MRYAMNRMTNGLIVIFFISLFTFLVLYWIPGDSAAIALGTESSPAALEAMREEMGLNQPVYLQYLNWLMNLIRGDMGNSFSYGEEVTTLLLQRLPVTFSLTLLSMLISVPFALIVGTLAALKQGTWVDGLSRTLMQIGDSVPQFWLALISVVYLAFNTGWFPIAGYVPLSEGLWPSLRSILLPSMVMAVGQTGPLIRIMRSSVLSALQEEYMLNTQINALSKTKTLLKYVFRAAATAPITVIGMQMAKLFGGTILIEEIFALPGVGRLLMHAVNQRDLILLQGIVIFITFMVVTINFLTDMINEMMNPMIRKGVLSEEA